MKNECAAKIALVHIVIDNQVLVREWLESEIVTD
jgi:hypothetical protein